MIKQLIQVQVLISIYSINQLFQDRRSVLWCEGARRHLDPLLSERVGVTPQGSAGIPAPHGHSDLTHFFNPVGDAHTLIANGLQTRSTHL